MRLQVIRISEFVTERTTLQMSFEGGQRDRPTCSNPLHLLTLEDILALEEIDPSPQGTA